jgi:hypothetical protein
MTKSPSVPQARQEPRLSVNKIGEYLTANPLRRQRILRDAKYPPAFQVKRYEEACEAIVGYFTGGRDMSAITRKIEEVSARRGGTTFEVESNLNTLEALEQFYDNADGIRLPENFRALSGLSGNLPPLTFNGTDISIRPEAIIQHELKGKPMVGTIKLYLSKTHPLSQESADYVGALVCHQMREIYTKDTEVNPKCCYVYDVFRSIQYLAPKSYTLKLNNIKAACTEISDRWGNII